MAIQNRATWARLKVGILAIFAMTILAVLIFLITGNTNIFESNVMIYTYMADAAALTTGAPVNLDGIPIGKVKTIALSGSKDPMRLVRLDMQIPEHAAQEYPQRFAGLHQFRQRAGHQVHQHQVRQKHDHCRRRPGTSRASTPASFKIWCSRALAC